MVGVGVGAVVVVVVMMMMMTKTMMIVIEQKIPQTMTSSSATILVRFLPVVRLTRGPSPSPYY